MKKTLILGILLQGSILAYSQVGINTTNPQATLHIDGGKDNPLKNKPTNLQQANDVVVTANGNLGIGTISPNADAALDIASANKGVKFPSISLQSSDSPAPLKEHVAGMVIYNTAKVGDLTPGLYINNGTEWVQLMTLASSKKQIKEAKAQAEVAALAAGSVPIGGVLYYATNILPDGYLECDGSAVSRTTYADLFAVLGTRYGIGNGSTTFNLPDLRGEFIRGYDNSRGVDTGRVIGTWQKGSFIAGGAGPNMDSVIPFVVASTGTLMPTLVNGLGWDLLYNDVYTANYPNTVKANNGNSDNSTNTQLINVSDNGSDYAYGVSRPRNVAMMPIIKY